MLFNKRSFFLAATAIELALLPGNGRSQCTSNCTNDINTTFGGAAGDTLAFIVPRGTVFPRTFLLPRGIVTVFIRSPGARRVSHRLVDVVSGASWLTTSTLVRRALAKSEHFDVLTRSQYVYWWYRQHSASQRRQAASWLPAAGRGTRHSCSLRRPNGRCSYSSHLCGSSRLRAEAGGGEPEGGR